ncbi:MAG: AI-2E family transporter [Burkholderiales bacterium]
MSARMPARLLRSRPHGAAELAGPGASAEQVFFGRIVAVALVAALAIAIWKAADVLLVAFGGVVLAVALRAFADVLARITPLRKRHTLPVAVALIACMVALAGWLIGETLANQFDQLVAQLPAALEKVREWLERTELGRAAWSSIGSIDGAESAAKLIGVMLGTFSTIANALLLVAIGIYLAADPGLYFRGFLRLVPRARRARASEVLSVAAATLRQWLAGQLIAMVLVGALTFAGLALLGVPLAFSLATIAGILEFVPFLGPILAAVPAVLVAFAHDASTALYVALLYFVVQQVEGYVLTPLLQRWAVALPPALGALSVVVFAVLFGLPGAFFGVPLAIVAMVLVRELYLEEDLL